MVTDETRAATLMTPCRPGRQVPLAAQHNRCTNAMTMETCYPAAPVSSSHDEVIQ
jgi:hypothetical protein